MAGKKVKDSWREAVDFQEDTLATLETQWLEGGSVPSLLILRTMVTHENIHLFNEEKLGQEDTLLYHVDNFLPLHQDASQLLMSLEKLYGFPRSEIEVLLQALDSTDLREADKMKALFYILMEDMGGDIDTYLTDYIAALVTESRATYALLICEADGDDGSDVLHCYLELDGGQVRIHNVKRTGPDEDELERIVLENPTEEEMEVHRSLGPFFKGEEEDDSAVECN